MSDDKLPEGMTCGDCAEFPGCPDRAAQYAICGWSPSRFRPKSVSCQLSESGNAINNLEAHVGYLATQLVESQNRAELAERLLKDACDKNTTWGEMCVEAQARFDSLLDDNARLIRAGMSRSERITRLHNRLLELGGGQ